MTDDELILMCGQRVTASQKAIATIIGFATPEIRRRLIEEMRELTGANSTRIRAFLDAFAKEHDHG